MPKCQTTLVIALDSVSLLFCIFINTTAYHYNDPWSSLVEGGESFHLLLLKSSMGHYTVALCWPVHVKVSTEVKEGSKQTITKRSKMALLCLKYSRMKFRLLLVKQF